MSLRRRTLKSVHDFAEVFSKKFSENGQIPAKYGSYLISTASFVGTQMSSSKGRDKICSLIQYLAQFYFECHNHSSIPEVRELIKQKKISSYRIAVNIESSMSSGRKIFRFLKFMDEIAEVSKVAKLKKKLSRKILMIIGHLASAVYFFLDNTVWFASVGFFKDFFTDPMISYLKYRKDLFSFVRLITNLCLSIIRRKNTISFATNFHRVMC
eukprot:TRINITY_DN4803_c0_g1_i4.p1 TRINITY_DN4803_c0_g1~~TRINITY_DN4803_c0_g1_i4.p1  ORF type:complete len:212 (+),score=37.04 TRINITY_DN4803_c0_g1_i4:28-663(+)